MKTAKTAARKTAPRTKKTEEDRHISCQVDLSDMPQGAPLHGESRIQAQL